MHERGFGKQRADAWLAREPKRPVLPPQQSPSHTSGPIPVVPGEAWFGWVHGRGHFSFCTVLRNDLVESLPQWKCDAGG